MPLGPARGPDYAQRINAEYKDKADANQRDTKIRLATYIRHLGSPVFSASTFPNDSRNSTVSAKASAVIGATVFRHMAAMRRRRPPMRSALGKTIVCGPQTRA
jgi:hypothetical protein